MTGIGIAKWRGFSQLFYGIHSAGQRPLLTRSANFSAQLVNPLRGQTPLRRTTGQVRSQSSSDGARELPLWVGQFRPQNLAYEKRNGSLIRVENALDESLGDYAETENQMCFALD